MLADRLAAWRVDDLEAEVSELRRRGVQFKDCEGNLMGLWQNA